MTTPDPQATPRPLYWPKDQDEVVRRVNAYPDLVAALQALVDKPGHIDVKNNDGGTWADGRYWIVKDDAMQQARAVLAAVEAAGEAP